MRKFLIYTMALSALSWAIVAFAMPLLIDEKDVFSNFRGNCPSSKACWLGIQPATTQSSDAILLLQGWSEGLLIDYSLSNQTAQWTHGQGYEGGMLFSDSVVSFIEINLPIETRHHNPIQLGDVLLEYGAPDDYARFPDGTSALYYYDRLVIVWIDTIGDFIFNPHQFVTKLMFPSPFGSWMVKPQGLIQRQAWHGWDIIGENPPWGP